MFFIYVLLQRDNKNNNRDNNNKDNRNNNRENNRDNRDNRRTQGNNNFQNKGNQNNRPNQQAQVIEDSKGKGKGGKQKHNDKQHGDKFDRLENEKAAQRQQKQTEQVKEEIKVITLPETISVKDFAAKLKMQPAALIKKMFLAGQILTMNDSLDYETAEAICLDMDILVEHEVEVDYIAELLKEEKGSEKKGLIIIGNILFFIAILL
mgnify:CR=1 FL=1